MHRRIALPLWLVGQCRCGDAGDIMNASFLLGFRPRWRDVGLDALRRVVAPLRRRREASVELCCKAPEARQHLAPRHVTSLILPAGSRLCVERGRLWVTAVGVIDDSFISAGDGYAATQRTRVVVECDSAVEAVYRVVVLRD
jgi:hypothetical protein